MPDLVKKPCTAARTAFWSGWRCFLLARLFFASLVGANLALLQPAMAEAQPSGAQPSGLQASGAQSNGAQSSGFFESLGLEQLARGMQLRAHALLLERVTEQGGVPSTFTTDGCSGGLSASWGLVAGHWPGFAARYQSSPPFEACCITHDRAYHGISGARTPEASYAARLQADQQLRHCVRHVGAVQVEELATDYGVSPGTLERGFWQLSQAMYFAVRFGGGPCSGLSWRWGYGYPGC